MFDPGLPIETERLQLRLCVPEDIDALYDIRSRPDVNRYLYTAAMTREEVQAKLDERISKYSKLVEPGDSLVLAIVRKDTGRMIGDVSFNWLPGEHQQVEIGYVLHPDHHGQGFASEAARPLLPLAFEGLKAHRVTGRLDGRNTASARVLAKLGMRQEAHFRENEFVKGEWTDEIVYAILASEWSANRVGR
ncbi:RimJ/RimL family protein N-acetyltransferase [Kibdelosporangium banguiense]|uniref:RimJ/RimL family protein N-acetyltransferase n=1 Tax=Kibdelosporangium banguiense TaxID=1365924 RepID=A0ABS4U2K3_9PSEU|nr:GNAT family protein [Kibdelosporangium banguiense]MBP2330889.1 RimJ/RimL family protein N-acetyltransferase [Kibdelosporangium banguiense]